MSGELASKTISNDLGEDHGNLLAKHDRLSFNTADTPSNNTKAINHGGVRVGSHDRVGVEQSFVVEDNTSEPFEVDLMDNTITRRNNSKVVEGFFSPLEEGKAFLVAVEFKSLVFFFSFHVAGAIYLDRVIDDQVGLHQRVNLIRVSTKLEHSSAHSGKVYNSRNSSEVLKEDTGGLERDFNILCGGVFPVEDALNIGS